MIINYTKMHGLKNDFIIIDGREKKIFLNKNKIKKIANRKWGLGCDQVVILEKPKKKNFCIYKILQFGWKYNKSMRKCCKMRSIFVNERI